MRRRSSGALVLSLALLYAAQGVPFGLAADYLPVALRAAGYSLLQIGAVQWLQLPWQLKIFWAAAADRPWARRRTRPIVVALEVVLALAIASYALVPLAGSPVHWFAVTAVAAFVASLQDVFVDALAVRTLRMSERGLGNTAQAGGYRLGMLFGGAGMLVLVGSLGERAALFGCAALVIATSGAAFVLRGNDGGDETPASQPPNPRGLLRRIVSREAHAVLVIASTFKLGLHVVGVVLKPMVVDAGWTPRQIGVAVVGAGTVASLAGTVGGGLLHRRLGERRALGLASMLQAASSVPILVALWAGLPVGATAMAIASEQFASGLGTTVLFAVTMSAARPADAGLHYTILASANGLTIGLGGLLGGWIADHAGKGAALLLGTALCAVPLPWLDDWDRARDASRA
jgi:predicted MFS family arabinose efflux permease